MTASPGDGEHAAREGYYPDPSIPGYVRYWNGLSWVPGTSRPAPPVDETGPVFLDETSATEALPEPSAEPSPEHSPEPEPEPAVDPVMWQADPAHQYGFGGPRDARVSWGSPEEPPGPVRGAGVSLARTAAPSPAAAPAPVPAPAPARQPAPASARGPAPDRSPESAAAAPSAPGHAWSPEAAPVPAPARSPEAEPASAPAPALAPGPARAFVPAPAWPDAGDGGRAGSGLTSSWPEATPQSRPAPAPTRVQPDPQAYAQAQAQAHAHVPSPSPSPSPGQGHAHVPSPSPSPSPGQGQGQGQSQGQGSAQADAPSPDQDQDPARAQPRAAARVDVPFPVHTPAQAAAPAQGQAGGGERGEDAGRSQGTATAAPEGARGAESGEAAAGERPNARAVFERMAERAVRPAGLVRRGLARAVDSLVFAAVAAAAARPFVPAATAHIEAKVEAARSTGRTTTVWLLDATIGGYLGIVLAAVLLFGVFYEALPTARWGRTPGKKLFGVRVLATATLRPPRFGAALRRWLAYALFGLPGGLWCLGDRPRRRAWHDRAAGTYVAR
ncbi:RDD family protein [Streptomyces goshikiensis]|uniref:RDD family protein n=1 Tax=Streptomyces goshikiensis TaxID=1942 RepID=UPI00371B8747